MNGFEILNKLTELGHIILLGEDDYAISNKVVRGIKETVQVPETVPKEIKGDLEKFISDCRIPFRSTGPSGNKYPITRITAYARKYFTKLLAKEEFSYEDIVAATTKYYKESNICRVTLTNFFESRLLEQYLEDHIKKKSSIVDGINEDGRVSL